MMIVVQDLLVSTMNVKTHVRPQDHVITPRYVELRIVLPSELFSVLVLMILSLGQMENVNQKVKDLHDQRNVLTNSIFSDTHTIMSN